LIPSEVLCMNYDQGAQDYSYLSSQKEKPGINAYEDSSLGASEDLDGNSSDEKENTMASLQEVRKVFNINGSSDNADEGQQEDSKNKHLAENDYFTLFLDPESRRYYRKIIGRDDYIRLEPLDDNANYKSNKTGLSEE
jgi:hypothetical protein